MATWQFDFHLLPADGVRRVLQCVPLTISTSDFDNGRWWEGVDPIPNFPALISAILPKLESWSRRVERWGFEDGDRIDVVSDDKAIAGVLVRVDVRELSVVFLANVLRVARQNSLVLRTECGKVIQPSLPVLLSVIQKSQAFRFVKNPQAFFEALDSALNTENSTRDV